MKCGRRGFLPSLVVIASALSIPFLVDSPAFASDVITPESAIQFYGLSKEPEVLVEYLSGGIPQEYLPDSSQAAKRRDFEFARWGLYSHVASYLGEIGYDEAAPALQGALDTKLPEVLQRDLDLGIAGLGGIRSWEEWDEAEEQALSVYRAACGMALARIGHEAALPSLHRLTSELQQLLRTRVSPDERNYTYPTALSLAARARVGLGDKSGITAMIETLDDLPLEWSHGFIENLRTCTGQPFGPEDDHSLQRRAEEIQKWRAWWARNESSFVIDTSRVLAVTQPRAPAPAPQTVRDQVALAATRYLDHEGLGYGEKAAEWMESNGRSRLSELLEIINDTGERASVRSEAMHWYVTFAGTPSFRLLRDYLLDVQRYSTPVELRVLHSKALSLLETHFSARLEKLKRKALSDYHEIPSQSVLIDSRDTEGLTLVVHRYVDLAPNAKLLVDHRVLQGDEAPALNILIREIKGRDLLRAQTAARAIYAFDLIPALPKDAREALAQWRKNPEFLIRLAGGMPPAPAPAELIEEAFSLLNAPDAKAAWTYRRAYMMASQALAYGGEALRDGEQTRRILENARAGLERCVEAYRARR